MFTKKQQTDLEAPLDRKNVSIRKQAGMSLSYIEGWHAIAEANRIFGFSEWDRETIAMTCVQEGTNKNGKDFVHYICRVRITVRAGETVVVREGTGFGSGIGLDVHEGAAKEAETDAMKRALMTFGNPFGLALYDKQQVNVQDTPAEPDPWETWADNAIKELEDNDDEASRLMFIAQIKDEYSECREYSPAQAKRFSTANEKAKSRLQKQDA